MISVSRDAINLTPPRHSWAQDQGRDPQIWLNEAEICTKVGETLWLVVSGTKEAQMQDFLNLNSSVLKRMSCVFFAGERHPSFVP